MCSSHSTGCERTCEVRSKISAHFGLSYLKLRKVPTLPWDGPFARKIVSPFRNVSTRKLSGDCRVWKRRIFSVLSGKRHQGRTARRAGEPLYRTALGGRCRLQYTSLRTDRKSTRLNSSHLGISYAVFCL